MAKPAFIYAFDNLGPERFTELCGLLLASRYKGFLLGGVGADGGIDAELDPNLGVWRPESQESLLNQVIQPRQTVVFQFKHKVTARVGQVATRKQLLSLYKCRINKKCELHRHLILTRRPSVYVLVTNVEINSEFRDAFVKQCKKENPKIKHYQAIGLDELEAWVTSEMELRHLYFPTIFETPRFNLKVQIKFGVIGRFGEFGEVVIVSVLNVGSVTSYIRSVAWECIVNGEKQTIIFLDPQHPILRLNPQTEIALEPGRSQDYYYPPDELAHIKSNGRDVFLTEFRVTDALGTDYRAPISDNVRAFILKRGEK